MGITLLTDLRTIFESKSVDRLSTVDILDSLHEIDESPWGDLRGKPLDARGLSQRLRKYDIRPATVRAGADVVKGYKVEELRDAWTRYLPAAPLATENSVTSVTADTEPSMDWNERHKLHDELSRQPGRCVECAWHIEKQGHAESCTQALAS